MPKKNILVFPCGSEVALEIHRSLYNSIHFNLIGGNSIDDHGKFVFENYIGQLPFADSPHFIDAIKNIVKSKSVDAVYPAMDSVISILKKYETEIGCPVISSSSDTCDICLSKTKTYEALKQDISVPEVYNNIEAIINFPVFLKPDVGYGSRGVLKAQNLNEIKSHISKYKNCIAIEYLPGAEYTIDCFTDYRGKLLFAGARQRSRIVNGISVNTSTMPQEDRFLLMATAINDVIKMNGAWFFQVKERSDGEIVLMEVAARLGGSSAAYRAKGINFAAMSVFNAFEIPVNVLVNDYTVELDRALGNSYRINIEFEHVYIDFDDTLFIDGKVNASLVAAIYNFLNKGYKVYLITKHDKDIYQTLKDLRLDRLFDDIIHLTRDKSKWPYIKQRNAIFIDDSFAERSEVKKELGIAVFGTDMIEVFL